MNAWKEYCLVKTSQRLTSLTSQNYFHLDIYKTVATLHLK